MNFLEEKYNPQLPKNISKDLVDFSNLETAFSGKSQQDLKKAYWLFKSLSYPWLVYIGQKLTSFAILIGIPIKGFIKSTLFKQFCGGEKIDECDPTLKHLKAKKVGAILDYSAEGNEKDWFFDKCTLEVLKTIRKAKRAANVPFAVFKITGIGSSTLLEKKQKGQRLDPIEMDDYLKLNRRLERLCKSSANLDVPILIDAEESWIQNTIDDLASHMMEVYNKNKPLVYNTVQMYRKDRLDYLHQAHKRSLELGYQLAVKLVRGAYMEKERERAKEIGYPSPIHDTKENTDHAFNDALRFCIENNIAVCIGTHNEQSCLLACSIMEELKIDAANQNIFFAQLLGMSDHISFNLSKAGYNVAKYVPFGPVRKVLPYLRRRAQENTSIKGQSGRELNMIQKELNRRGQNKPS